MLIFFFTYFISSLISSFPSSRIRFLDYMDWPLINRTICLNYKNSARRYTNFEVEKRPKVTFEPKVCQVYRAYAFWLWALRALEKLPSVSHYPIVENAEFLGKILLVCFWFLSFQLSFGYTLSRWCLELNDPNFRVILFHYISSRGLWGAIESYLVS